MTSTIFAQRASVAARDVSGAEIFARGEAGAAHVAAHRMLDANRVELGYRMLGEWLDGRAGSGSEWTHLQFHMAVFELTLGHWEAAHRRFLEEIVPVASATQDALTDAPAVAWRVIVSGAEAVELPWRPLRRAALAGMQRRPGPFVQIHNFLALAGAGDVASIERWLRTRAGRAQSEAERIVEEMAAASMALAAGDYREAAAGLERLLPALPRVGGSRAQNQLFERLAEWCRRRAAGEDIAIVYASAA